MAKVKTKTARRSKELDGVFILKIVLYLVIGAQWVMLTDPGMTKRVPLPVGLVVGVLFATHDHFQIDRKIEFAVLLVACLVGFWSQTGISAVVLK